MAFALEVGPKVDKDLASPLDTSTVELSSHSMGQDYSGERHTLLFTSCLKKKIKNVTIILTLAHRIP